jgi:hypothetical protein
LRMKYKGVFDNTVMIIMGWFFCVWKLILRYFLGDHGQRMSEIQHTYSGRIEERMPLFGVYFPEKFRQAYPDKVLNFMTNKVNYAHLDYLHFLL